MQLRDYQEKFVGDIRRSFSEGNRSVCAVAPCGSGKTVVAAHVIEQAIQRGNKSIFIVHRQELIEQTAATFARLGIPFDLIIAGRNTNYNVPVFIASVQTLIKRLDSVPEPQFIICDECHHILAETYLQIVRHWNSAFLLGLTATPQRLGGVRLGDVFTSLIEGPSVANLIRSGNLTHFVHYAPVDLDFSSLKVRAGDYVTEDAASFMSKQKIIGDIVWNYKERASGKQAICYCVNVEHSKLMAEKFKAAGISAAHCDGETPKSERQQIIYNFRRGNLKILCNVDLFGEGFDVPNVDAVILARPTKSLTLYIQQAMRAMRPEPNNPNKVAIILDHVNHAARFGDIDQKRNWSLAANLEKEPQPPPIKICPQCKAVLPLSARICPNCEYDFAFEQDITEHAGVLNKVASSLEEFLNEAKRRGYKKAWAVHRALEKAETYEDCKQIAAIMHYKAGWAWYKWKEIGG